jgi:hypothetical protein
VEEDILAGAGHHNHYEAAAHRSHLRRDIAGQDSKTWQAKVYVCEESELGRVLRACWRRCRATVNDRRLKTRSGVWSSIFQVGFIVTQASR